jgi:hypothetical protein
MSRYINGKLYSIISYEDRTPVAENLVFLEACTTYDIVEFTELYYNHPIDCLPNNVKFICLSRAEHFKQPLRNLPSGIIGLILPRYYSLPLEDLPHGIKYLYYNTTRPCWTEILELSPNLPATLKYIGASLQYYDMETQDSIHYKVDGKMTFFSIEQNILKFYDEELFPKN